MMISLRNALVGNKASGEYTFLEYIQSQGIGTSDGTKCSWIDTGVEVAYGMTAHIEWQWVSQPASGSSGFSIIFGGGKKISYNWRTWAVGKQNNGASNYATQAIDGGSFSTSTVNGWEISDGTCANFNYHSNPIDSWYLFAQNEGWNGTQFSFHLAHFGIMRLRYAWLKMNDVMIHEYMPARRNSDNVIGLFDNVTKEFLTSQSSVPFITG